MVVMSLTLGGYGVHTHTAGWPLLGMASPTVDTQLQLFPWYGW